MEFLITRCDSLNQQDGLECTTRFGVGNIYISHNHFRIIEDDSSKRQLLKKSISRVAVEVFSYCNRQCSFCPNASGLRRNQQNYLDEDIYIRILSDLNKVDYDQKFMFHLYNEPLADSIILKRIRQAKLFIPQAELQINTNGDYLDRRCLDNLVDVGVSRVEMSIYGPNNSEFDEDYILDKMHLEVNKLGLQYTMHVNQPGIHYSMVSVDSGTTVIIMGRNFDKIGVDRGGLIDIENKPSRTSPCFAPFIDLDIDYQGNFLPCCNVYCDDERHKGYATGNLHDGRSVFEHYTDDRMVNWRKRLFQFHPNIPICKTCSRKEFPELATDANVKEVNELYEELNRVTKGKC